MALVMTKDIEPPPDADDRRGSISAKLEAISIALQHEFPSGDVDEMLAEIEIGYLQPCPVLD